jgi:hypothetical protein
LTGVIYNDATIIPSGQDPITTDASITLTGGGGGGGTLWMLANRSGVLFPLTNLVGTLSVAGITLIDTVATLNQHRQVFPFAPSLVATEISGDVENRTVSVDCEGVPKALFLIQVSTHDAICPTANRRYRS